MGILHAAAVCPAWRAAHIGPAALLPIGGVGAAGLAGLGLTCRVGRGGDPAGVWLHSNPGDYYRWDAHTQAQQRWYLLLASGLTPAVSPWSEVITCLAVLHGELRDPR